MTEVRDPQALWDLLSGLFRAHPWHGVSVGDAAPEIVTCYIELVPTDTVKYEVDKLTGFLKVDRPQKFSNVCPSLYGLLPRTYCGEQVAAFAMNASGRTDLKGDADPLDVCVLAERPITHGDILLQARPIGALGMLDGDEVDDKIVAVLSGDAAYGHLKDISDCPRPLIDRLVHYFETYKHAPGAARPCEVEQIYGREAAYEIIRRAQRDYHEKFGTLTSRREAVLKALPHVV